MLKIAQLIAFGVALALLAVALWETVVYGGLQLAARAAPETAGPADTLGIIVWLAAVVAVVVDSWRRA